MKPDKKSAGKNDLKIELPELPQGWAWSNVEQLAQAGEQPVLTGPFGSTLGTEDFIAKGVPLLTIGCLTESGISLGKASRISPEKAAELRRYQVRPGDLLFSRSASVGRAGLVNESLDGSVINYHLMRLRIDAGILDPRLFIFYVRGSEVVKAFLREVNHGATRDGINTADLLRMPVPLPPRTTQRRIVAKIEELFSDLDAGVVALKRAKANLKRYRAAVLKAAVEGKLTEEWRAKHPQTEPASKLLARILTERRQKWEADQLAKFAAAGKEPPKGWRDKYVEPTPPHTEGLPKLPDGWCWVSLSQILTSSQNGFGKRQQEYGIPTVVLRLADISDGLISLTDTRSVNATTEEIKKYSLQHDDLLVVRVNGSNDIVGRFVRFDTAPEPIMFCDHFIQLRFVVSDLSEFVRVFGDTRHVRRFVELNKVSSAGQNTINQTALDRLPISIPPLAEQTQIMNAVSERLSQIDAAATAINHGLIRAARLRQSILKQAFEGKLVPQDPHDEPASVLLARIRQQGQVPTSKTVGPTAKARKLPKEVFLTRAAIVSYAVRRLAASRSFGRTQLEKTVHLAQCHLGIEMGFVFERYQAGPFDKDIYKLEAVARKNDWFTTQKRASFGVTYHPGEKIEGMCQYASTHLGAKQSELDRLLDQISKMDTDGAELFATAYAAWNDLLIDGRTADDDVIAAEIYAWDPSKAKFDRDRIGRCLEWMRQSKYVPQGQGQRTSVVSKAAKPTAKRHRKTGKSQS